MSAISTYSAWISPAYPDCVGLSTSCETDIAHEVNNALCGILADKWSAYKESSGASSKDMATWCAEQAMEEYVNDALTETRKAGRYVKPAEATGPVYMSTMWTWDGEDV